MTVVSWVWDSHGGDYEELMPCSLVDNDRYFGTEAKQETMKKNQRGTVANVPQPTTYNYVNRHYFMALSHTFYVIKVFSEGQLT
jgi:hypothetical protein